MSAVAQELAGIEARSRAAGFTKPTGRCRDAQCTLLAPVPEFDGFCVNHATSQTKAASTANREAKTWSGIDTEAIPAPLLDEMATDLYLRADVSDLLRRRRARDIVDEIEAGHGDTNRIKAGILTRAQLADLPKPEPLIEDTLDRNTTVLVGGHYGTLKSFIVQDWACSIATGKPWQGRAVTQGRVLYVAAEGAEGLHRRISAWEEAWHVKVNNLDVWPFPLPLTNIGDRRALTELVQEKEYALVVFDTLARCSVGLEENSAKDMGLVIDAADTIKRAARSTVLLVHHTGKDKVTMRGSSSLEDGVDTVYMSEGDAGFVKLQRTKRKEGSLEDVHTLRLKQFGESGVIENVNRLERTTNSDKLKSLFVDMFADTGASKSELRNAAGLGPSSFAYGLNALVRDGSLVNTGTEQRPFYHLAGDAK